MVDASAVERGPSLYDSLLADVDSDGSLLSGISSIYELEGTCIRSAAFIALETS